MALVKMTTSSFSKSVLAIMVEEALLEAHVVLLTAQLRHHQEIVRLKRMREQRQRKKARRLWYREWLGPLRRKQFGIYDQLMVELRREDPASFRNFMRMPPDMFDEILLKITPRITKQHTWYRPPLEPGMKLAITLRHLASGARYMDMRYAWRIPHNTISKIVREVNITLYFFYYTFMKKQFLLYYVIFLILCFQVCSAIINVYLNELMALPTTADEWKTIADGFQRKWNFPHCLGAIDGKHVAIKCPPNSGSTYFNYKKFFSVILMAIVDSDYKIIWADIGGRGAASDAQIWNASDIKGAIDAGEIALPVAAPLPNDTQPVPWWFVGEYNT